ncbi:Structural maintenance of chromosomes protein [Actinidia chinensis var. chinensis]|uniref:Structural maintenance of chromosomes protein n=1 Tax=Actinidia chinensis var. chinensis TaxID=1590841 RepID=A0A2R6RKC7_ACTCC|nr:Structural maintenance of chromosomes protein [Actinidia chinensis var. chinensis]
MEATIDEFTSTDSESTRDRSRTPRLFIREMVLRNFKSYAGEQRVGPFHKSFSAVVGPNGSGKSNVIDAMLFVFGKRAKQMRLNKVSELIHNSTNHQNLDSAGVSVHFQEIIDLDDGTYEAVAGTDFVITRIAFRDNSSKYYINDRMSTFTEVTKKLKGKGVDLDNNRFLILQGEVEQISLMKPKAQGPHDEGFLEYLEDIIGTNKYVEKIDESYKELESLNEKRSGVVQMVKLAEKERDSLEDVKNEAEAYMLKELSLLKWQEKATKLASEDTSTQMVEKQAKVSSLEENLKIEREKIHENNKTLKELEALHMKYMKKQEELDSGLRSCKEEFKEFERQDIKYREDLKHMKQRIKKLDEKIEKDSSKIDDITKDCADSTNQIPRLEENIPKLQNFLLEEERVLEEIKENSKVETEIFRGELAKVRVELEPWEKQLIEHKGKLDVACTERNLLNEKHEASRATYEDAQKQMNDIQLKIGTKTSGIVSIQNELEKNKSDALEARKMEQDCLKEQEVLIPLEQAARQKVSELLSVMEAEKSQGSVLKAILHAKEMSDIKGIYGRMGDLGAIDAKYDVAISTACPGLDYIVVETTSAAQACVELLRRKNLGVATFMILEKQVDHLPRLKEKVSTPEGVPRLFDLIKVQDERMKLAFFAALGNTVVAENIDQATRIAYGGNKEFRRVVTVDGALFETSGTMSGGGSKPRGGKMGTAIRATSVSAEAIADAENELAELVEKLSNIRQKIADAARRYQVSEKAFAHLEMELAKSQKEIDSMNMQIVYLEKQLHSLKAASEPRKDELNRLDELRKIISAEENEIDRLTQFSKQLKEKALGLQSKIENAGGERLKNQKSKVNKIHTATRIAYGGNKEFRRVVTVDGALFETSGTMSGGGSKPRGGKMGTAIRATSVSAEAIADAENELAELVEKLSNIRQKIADAARRYQVSEKAFAHLEMELAKSQKEIDSMNMQIVYLEKQLHSLKAASEPRKDELNRLDELRKIISAEENEIDRLTQFSKQLKEKALGLQSKIENAGGERLKNQKSKVNKIHTDIDKSSTEINRHKVQIETGQKMIKKLMKGIEESKKEKERLIAEKEKLLSTFKEIEQKAFKVQENYKKTQELIDQHKDVLDKAKTDYEKLKKTVDELRASEVDADYKLQDMKKAYKELEMKGKGYKKRLDDLHIAFLKHMEQIQKDLVDREKLQATLTDGTLGEAYDLKRALEMVALLEAQLKEMNPNLDSISEYRKKLSSYNERVEDLNLVTQQRDDTKKQYDDLRKKRLDEFMAGFNTISLKLKEMYQMITLGGDAELELVDSLDPFSEGVVFSVRPPKKSWKNIANLSGGEKTLSSLALVFALHHYKPTPLYVMDEIDAALDFKNVSIVGHYVKDRTKDAQFIIISLRNNMFELADRLVGIYKTDNCTKSITINPASFVVCQKAS